MPKYKLSNGKIIDTTNYSAQKLMFFQSKYPDAVLVEDFQTDPASAETNVGSQKIRSPIRTILYRISTIERPEEKLPIAGIAIVMK